MEPCVCAVEHSQSVSLPTGQPQVLALKCKNWTICARSIELPHQCPKSQAESSLHQHHRTICWEIMSAEKFSQSDQSPAGRICIPHPTPSGVHGRFDKIVVQNTNYRGIWWEKVPAGNRHHFMQLGQAVQGELSLCSQGICAQHKLSHYPVLQHSVQYEAAVCHPWAHRSMTSKPCTVSLTVSQVSHMGIMHLYCRVSYYSETPWIFWIIIIQNMFSVIKVSWLSTKYSIKIITAWSQFVGIKNEHYMANFSPCPHLKQPLALVSLTSHIIEISMLF